MAKANVGLGRRLQPTQKRAKDTVRTILETTAELLDEVGLESFNTNLLAERANLRIRTIYRYFPNKYAVIFALTEDLAVEWDRAMAETYRLLADPKADWRAALKDARGGDVSEGRGGLSDARRTGAAPAAAGDFSHGDQCDQHGDGPVSSAAAGGRALVCP